MSADLRAKINDRGPMRIEKKIARMASYIGKTNKERDLMR